MSDTPGELHGQSPSDTSLPDTTRTGLYRLLGGLDRLELLSQLPDRTMARDGGDVRIARYRARWKIGAGRFGLVFAADDADLGRLVVVKVPQPAVLTDPSLRERFVREARAAARLDHPGVVPILDAGEDSGLPYMVAGLVDGPTLAEWLANQGTPPDPRIAAELVARLAAAVQHAHDRGVLHCDLKPANVLLDRPGPGEHGVPDVGVPRVTDFGLARLLEDDPALTRTLQRAGTPLYMAPEQARGDRRNLTAHADLYSVGAILYELLTGRPPFIGASEAEVLARLLNEPVIPPRRLNPRVPRDLEAVCLKCLEKRPEDRYPTAAALADDLNRFLNGEPTTARPLGSVTQVWRFIRRRPAFAALTIVALAAMSAIPALAIWYSSRLQTEAEARKKAETEAAAKEFVAALEHVRQRRLEMSPGWAAANLADVRRAAGLPLAGEYAAELRTEAVAALTAVDPPSPRVLLPGFKGYAAAFRSDGLLAVGSWLPDGSGTCEVKLINPEKMGDANTLTYKADADWEKRYNKTNTDGCRSLTFSPDGRWLVLGSRSGRLIIWDVNSTSSTPISRQHGVPLNEPNLERVKRVAFTPSGRMLVSSDGRTLKWWDPDRSWTEVFQFSGPKFVTLARPARIAEPLIASTSEGILALSDDPPSVRNRTGQTAGSWPTVAPGGEMAIGSIDRLDTLCPVEIKSGKRLPPLNLPNDNQTEDADITDVLYNPSGSLLATSAEHIGHLKLWCVATGQLLMSRVISGDNSLGLAFSPDGRSLVVCAEQGVLLYDLSTLSVAGELALQAPPLIDAAVSPSGDVVVTSTSGPEHKVRTAVWNTPPGERPASPAQVDHTPAIGRNHSQLVAVSADGRTVANITGDGVRVRTDLHAQGEFVPIATKNVRDLQFGPDGRIWFTGQSGLGVWSRSDHTIRIYHFPDPTNEGTFACVAPGRNMVVAGGTDGRISLFRPDEASTAFEPHTGDISALALSPDEQFLAAGTVDGGLRVYLVATGQTVVDLPEAHRNTVQSIAYGPGGWFVTGSRDRSVKFWTKSGKLILTLSQSHPVTRVFVSTNGQTMTLLAEREHALHRWQLDQLQTRLTELHLEPGLR